MDHEAGYFDLAELQEITDLAVDLLYLLQEYAGIIAWQSTIIPCPNIDITTLRHSNEGITVLDEKQKKTYLLDHDYKICETHETPSPRYYSSPIYANYPWVIYLTYGCSFFIYNLIDKRSNSIDRLLWPMEEALKKAFFILEDKQVEEAKLERSEEAKLERSGGPIICFANTMDVIRLSTSDGKYFSHHEIPLSDIQTFALNTKNLYLANSEYLLIIDRSTQALNRSIFFQNEIPFSIKLHLDDRYLYVEWEYKNYEISSTMLVDIYSHSGDLMGSYQYGHSYRILDVYQGCFYLGDRALSSIRKYFPQWLFRNDLLATKERCGDD